MTEYSQPQNAQKARSPFSSTESITFQYFRVVRGSYKYNSKSGPYQQTYKKARLNGIT